MDNDLLKARVKQSVMFSHFVDGALWYSTFDGWTFPVPVAETTNAQGSSPTFRATEKGILLMRWIRRCMEQTDG